MKDVTAQSRIVPQNVLALEGDPSFDRGKQYSPNMASGNVSESLMAITHEKFVISM